MLDNTCQIPPPSSPKWTTPKNFCTPTAERKRVDFALPAVREALKDLYSDKATQRVMGPLLDHARRDEHAQGRNRMPGNRKPGNNRYWTGGKLRFREHPDKPDLGIETFTVRR